MNLIKRGLAIVKRTANAVKDVATSTLKKVLATPLKTVAAAAAPLALTGPTYAQSGFSIDTTEVVGVITAGVTTVSAIGIAVLSLVVVIKLFKWVQRVL